MATQPAGTSGPAPSGASTPAAAKLPSIEILSTQTTLAGTCGGATFNVNTYIRVDSQSSADVRLSATGFPNLEQFTDETGANVGTFNGIYPSFKIPAFGGGLAPNTPIRIIINTYSGPALSGTLSYGSTIQFDCTTGAILNLVAADPDLSQIIPTLSDASTAALAFLLAFAGGLALRRRSVRATRHDSAPRNR